MVGVFCALRDKEWEEMLTSLGSVLDELILTSAPTAPESRAWDLEIVRGYVERQGIRATIQPDFDRALSAPKTAATVVVTGSFHTVGDAMTRLQVSPFAL
jgi:dihydrofolate synthase / folylpolyglutamate synthase